MKEFTTAVQDMSDDANEVPEDERVIPFMLDGRELKAHQPTDGQLTFMLASMGRGQSQDQRVSSVLNMMLAVFNEDDKDYLEGRLLTRDPKRRLSLAKIEEIFEYLVEEWFGHPTQSSSGSAESPPSTGPN